MRGEGCKGAAEGVRGKVLVRGDRGGGLVRGKPGGREWWGGRKLVRGDVAA